MPSAYRKKRDQERKERTRNQLLLAATKVFARRGYHKALITHIVTEAGVGQGPTILLNILKTGWADKQRKQYRQVSPGSFRRTRGPVQVF